MEFTAKQISQLVKGTIEGNPEVKVSEPSKIEEGLPGTITFLANPKYEAYAYSTEASIILVSNDFKPAQPINSTLIKVENVYQAVSELLSNFDQKGFGFLGISEDAYIHPSASIGANTHIAASAYIEPGVSIGENCIIYPQTYIGANVSIGANTIVYSGAKVYHNCLIGSHCILHANCVIGSDGFGFAFDPLGNYKKISQIGNVVLEDQVEVGANTVIDRATMGSTVIRFGVKLDNLIQIAHNVEIGANTAIAAQAGIAGSTKIGSRCLIGGQVGIAGHLYIDEGSQIQAQSGIPSSLKGKNKKWYGSPALDYQHFLRAYSIFKKLPELWSKILKLEKKLSDQDSNK